MPPGWTWSRPRAVTLAPGARHAVATGFAIAIPEGYEVQVRPRSGLALKHGITCLNTPGTIDADYRGEVKVILANLGDEAFEVVRGERIAQLVPAPVVRARFSRSGGARRDGARRRRLRIHREVMMKHLFAAILLLAAAPVAAQTVETATGDWSDIPEMQQVSGAAIEPNVIAAIAESMQYRECVHRGPASQQYRPRSALPGPVQGGRQRRSAGDPPARLPAGRRPARGRGAAAGPARRLHAARAETRRLVPRRCRLRHLQRLGAGRNACATRSPRGDDSHRRPARTLCAPHRPQGDWRRGAAQAARRDRRDRRRGRDRLARHPVSRRGGGRQVAGDRRRSR